MQIDFKTCTEEELWKYVASHLKSRSIDTVLVGGAVVSIYTEGAYESGDLDLILTNFFVKNLKEAMQEIGFKKQGRHFIHPECAHLFVEFPKGPLEIGDDIQIEPVEKTFEGKVIKILSPTDCVKDRLATYIHFKDRVGLEQALLVAKNHPISYEKVKAWCEREGANDVYLEFEENLKRKSP